MRHWLALLLLVSCQTTPSDLQNTGSDEYREHIVIVYMGGFNSCEDSSPDELYAIEEFHRMRRELSGENINVHWVLSCFDGMRSTLVRWKSCDEPDDVYAARWDRPHPEGQLWWEIMQRSQDLGHKVFVIGHSYGGWLASNFVANAGRWHEGNKRVEALFTIDPISPYHCSQAIFGATLFASLGGVSPGSGCEQGPVQYHSGDGELYPDSVLNNRDGKFSDYIQQATANWTNFYQRRDYLRSSATGTQWADDIEVRYEGRDGLFLVGTNSMPHIRIHAQPEVWSRIRGEIYASLDVGVSAGLRVAEPNVITVQAADPPPPALTEPLTVEVGEASAEYQDPTPAAKDDNGDHDHDHADEVPEL